MAVAPPIPSSLRDLLRDDKGRYTPFLYQCIYETQQGTSGLYGSQFFDVGCMSA